MKLAFRISLFGMILFGLRGAGALSLEQFQTGEACPVLGDTVPACYIAFAGYILIGLGAVANALFKGPLRSIGNMLFWFGTMIAGGLALVASIMEIVKGDVCPVAFGFIPMCYVSLAFSVVIALLYYLSQKPQAS